MSTTWWMEANQYACLAVTQLHQRAKISVYQTTHRAGIDMGKIDTMSWIQDDENPLSTAAQTCCLDRLSPHKYWQCQQITELQTLFRLVDPSALYKHNSYHHTAYVTISIAVTNLTHVLTQDDSLQNRTLRDIWTWATRYTPALAGHY